MSTSPTPEPRPANCPYCEKILATIDAWPYFIGSWAVLSVACSNCHALLHMQIQPAKIAAPQEDPPEKSPLWKPS
jgi:hypothetical protein